MPKKRRKRTSYSIRCHPDLLKDLAKRAKVNSRSKNAEIVQRLEASLHLEVALARGLKAA